MKIYHNQCVYTGGPNSPVLTVDVVMADEAIALEGSHAHLLNLCSDKCREILRLQAENEMLKALVQELKC